MQIHFVQVGLAFVEGLGLILSPCILPILPIMLAASLDGGKKRPLGIIAGFIAAFTVFALLSRQLLSALHADPQIVRDAALGLLVVFGLVMLSKKLSDKLLGATQGLADFGQNLTARWNGKEGFLGGVAIGALIGLIWAPCAGPIMAAAIVQIIQAKTNLEAVLTVVMFAAGAGLPMLLIALMGRQIMSRLNFLKTHSYGVRRVLGIIIILAAVLIYEGADVQLLAQSSSGAPAVNDGKLHDALANPYPAPQLAGIAGWINSPPLKIAGLKGKVVLVDFWTYSCINCVRTLPYIKDWYAKYHDRGLEIIGVHSPEFEFEKKPENVKMAVKKFGITYPVALDNSLATWTAFNNRFWPAHYLIDQNGRVVYTHFGEGDYDITENNIRALLGLGPEKMAVAAPEAVPAASGETQEAYLGYARARNFIGPAVNDATAHYDFKGDLPLHHWTLSGDWTIGAENITSDKPQAGLKLHFLARKVFLVLGAKGGKTVHVHVTLNGNPADSADVKAGVLTVDQERLYELLDQGESKEGTVELKAEEPGLQAYAFTFGG